jgi:hypothetical protein
MEKDQRQFIEVELKLINQMFDTQKEIYPMCVLVKDDRRFLVPVSYSSSAHKDIVSQGIKDLVKTSDPDVVVYVAEAWSGTIRSKFDRLPLDVYSNPERIEIVMAQIEFKTGEKYGCEAKIIRDGGAPKLGEFKISTGDCSFGRFTDFFPIKRTN